MRILYLTFSVALADQITKLMVKGIAIPALGINVQGLMLGSSRPIFGDFLRLTYIENPGMAFGIDIGGKLFFSIFSIIASAAIAFYLYHARNEGVGFRIALALILGGAIGNLVDRVFYGVIFNEGPLFYGKVVDFLDCDFFNVTIFGYHMTRWPVFNIADASVTCGVVLLLLTHRSASPSDEMIAGQMNIQTAGEGVSADVVASSAISLNESSTIRPVGRQLDSSRSHQPESPQSSGTPPQL